MTRQTIHVQINVHYRHTTIGICKARKDAPTFIAEYDDTVYLFHVERVGQQINGADLRERASYRAMRWLRVEGRSIHELKDNRPYRSRTRSKQRKTALSANDEQLTQLSLFDKAWETN